MYFEPDDPPPPPTCRNPAFQERDCKPGRILINPLPTSGLRNEEHCCRDPEPPTTTRPRPTCDTETNGCRRCGTSRTEKRSNYSTLEGSAATCWACCQPPTTRARTCTYPHNFNYCGNYGMIPKNPLPNTGPRTKENCCQPAPTCRTYSCPTGYTKQNLSSTNVSKSHCCKAPTPTTRTCLPAGTTLGQGSGTRQEAIRDCYLYINECCSSSSAYRNIDANECRREGGYISAAGIASGMCTIDANACGGDPCVLVNCVCQ